MNKLLKLIVDITKADLVISFRREENPEFFRISVFDMRRSTKIHERSEYMQSYLVLDHEEKNYVLGAERHIVEEILKCVSRLSGREKLANRLWEQYKK